MTATVPAGVFDVLRDQVAIRPGATALVTRAGRWSYAELDDLADRAAGALQLLGIRPGDRVAASLPNDVDVVAAFHGAMRLGAVWVGINQALAPPEKAFMLEDCDASVVLADDAVAESMSQAAGRGIVYAARTVGPAEWAEALAASPGRSDGPDPDPDAPAAIAYTSGTTGFPKGAVHAQAGLVLPGAATVASRGWGPSRGR